MEKSLKINIPEGYEIDEEKSTFAEIVFKPIDSLETWGDCVKFLRTKDIRFGFITTKSEIQETCWPQIVCENVNLLPSKEIAEKFLILQKLYTCRQAYIGNWKPNWSNPSVPKFCITNVGNIIEINSSLLVAKMFSFPNRELAEKFLKNFKEDLEFIKELL